MRTTTAAEVGSARIAELSNYEGALLNSCHWQKTKMTLSAARSAGLTFSQPLDKREAWHGTLRCVLTILQQFFIAGLWPQTEGGHGGCV